LAGNIVGMFQKSSLPLVLEMFSADVTATGRMSVAKPTHHQQRQPQPTTSMTIVLISNCCIDSYG
jgi:hypothetical protein